MSSSTITVNPRRRPARSPPPPAAKTDDTTPKGTVLLRNPLPKYSFQQKLDKKNVKKKDKSETGETKSLVDKDLNAKNVEFDLHTPELRTGNKVESGLDPVMDKSDQNPDLRIGVLVNSFPQNSVSFTNQTAEVEKSFNQDGTIKKASNNIEPEVVKTMIDKLKPVNIVDPITCSSNSGTRLSHSYSESAISSTSPGFSSQQGQSLHRSQGSTSVLPESDSLETSQGQNEQTGTQPTPGDQDEAEASADNEAPGLVPSSSEDVAGSCQCQERVKLLEEEKQLLKQQLEVQLQVML